MIPVIDLFAGPGGLGEGFGSCRDDSDNPIFDIRASFEKEAVAHRTLSLRAFYRAFGHPSDVPGDYYHYLRGDRLSREDLFGNPRYRHQAEKAMHEAHCLELGDKSAEEVDRIIATALKDEQPWVLIGGPPCQVYSVVGRSRWRKKDVELFEMDHRHFLYKEYLRIIQKFQPAVFVMENVRGVLSSTHGGSSIFEQILEDLSDPSPGLSYQIRSFNYPSRRKITNPMDFVVEAENHGLPQARHRVMLFGVRQDMAGREHRPLHKTPPATVRQVLDDMPRIRSMISRGQDSLESWSRIFDEMTGMVGRMAPDQLGHVLRVLNDFDAGKSIPATTGSRFIPGNSMFPECIPRKLAEWLHDERLMGYCQHEARSHMKPDLHRYLFAACHAEFMGRSPKVEEFPYGLLPEHDNVFLSSEVPFKDRFRVQLPNSPSTTVVSHISKDGHYYIHYDPTQCRSLTVREAARLQTFPDNYFFEGNRTQQYWQVGNAVPPFLARQVAKIVAEILHDTALRLPADGLAQRIEPMMAEELL